MAAKKKTAKKKTSKSTAMVSMADYEKQMMADASSDSARTASHGSGTGFISIKGGSFSFGDADLGEELKILILGFASTNTYYDCDYDPNDPNSPACAAVGMDDNDYLEPSENSPAKVSDNCEECEFNEWGSADTGKGKKCKNGKRLAVMSVDDLEEDEPTIALINVPSTSLTNFNKFVKGLEKTLNRPTYGVTTLLSFDDSADYEVLKFKVIEPISDISTMEKVMAARAGIEDILLEEPDFSNYHVPVKVQRPARKKAKKKTAHRK